MTSQAQRIRQAREARHWSREQLAVYADVSMKTVFSVEQENYAGRANAKTLRRIGKTLGIDLLGEEEVAS